MIILNTYSYQITHIAIARIIFWMQRFAITLNQGQQHI